MNALFGSQNLITLSVLFAIGALAAFMSQRCIAVFHDGNRTYAAEVAKGSIPRSDWLKNALPVSVGAGLLIGLPFSILSGYILIHLIFLFTDLIGARCKNTAVAALLGGGFAALLKLCLLVLHELFRGLPIGIGKVTVILAPVVTVGFLAVCVLAIYNTMGKWVALATAVCSITCGYTLGFDYGILAGFFVAVLFAFFGGSTKPEMSVVDLFLQNKKRVLRGLPYTIAMGGLIALGVYLGLLAEGPQSLLAAAGSNTLGAGSISLVRALSFLPIKSLTAVTSGVLAADGLGLATAAGFFAWGGPVAALLAGGVVALLETVGTFTLARLFENRPKLKEFAENIRQVGFSVLNYALLGGCIVATLSMGSYLGTAIIIGAYMLNAKSKKIPQISVCLIALICIWLLQNVTQGLFGFLI